ncbi:MAG: T9SS type A sorting domain-containing protein, partial [Bacteroidota bacterium]
GMPVPDLIASGTNITWYDTSMAIVSTNDTFATGITATGSYTYFVTQSDAMTGCESAPDTVTLAINALPGMPSALDTTVCASLPIPNLTATGTNVQWYDTSWTLVFTGNSYATGQTAAGTYIYYVTVKDSTTGCESAADTSILNILNAPPVPTANNVAVCFGNPVPALTSTGNNVTWYSDAALTTVVATGNIYNTGQTAIGVYTYWVTDSLAGCLSSGADSVSLIINPAPAKPTANDTTICYGTSAVLTSTGNNPQWYSDATLINMVGSGSPFNTGITAVGTYTYYVADYAAGCGNSPSDTVVFTINPVPLVTANTYSTTIVMGNSTTLTAYNAVSYSWAPGGQTTQSIVVSPTVTTTYTVTGTNQYGCSSSVTIVVQVDPLSVPSVSGPADGVNVYPNPAIGSFTVEFFTDAGAVAEVYMTNLIGERVRAADEKEVTVTGGVKKYKYTISTRTFTEGIYNLEIVTAGGTVTRRVVLFR